MQFELGCIEEIPDEKLKELLATLATRVRDAKKKVASHLKSDQHLMHLWVGKIASDPPKALPEEVIEIRNQRRKEFELALLADPEAFVAFQVSSFLFQLNEVVRQERNRRAPPPKNSSS